jgi:RNA 2',3'-cyclic 3'-phosphodiesterase
MHRLFVAIRPPTGVRSQLSGLMGGVPGARWQDDGQLHLTLRFVGEVDVRTAEDIADALPAVRANALELRLDGVGTFDRRGVVDTLWAGVAPREPLEALHRKIDRALVGVGLPPEGRAYRPHVTLARFGRRGGDVSAFAERNAALTSALFAVSHFGLFESRIGHGGASYQEIATYRLENAGG